MSLYWGERPSSRATTSQDPTYIARYVAAGTKSSAEVKLYAMTATTSTVATVEGTLFRNDIHVTPSAEGPLVWEVDVHYGRVNRQTGSYSFRWEGVMGTERTFVSLEAVARYPADAPDYRGMIGVDLDGIATGTDVPVPSSSFVIEFRHPEGVFTAAYAAVLEEIQGHVNSTTFFGRPAGEIMFWDFRGSEGTDAETTIEYSFVRKKNWTDVTIGSITGINKRGHDHIWYRYTQEASANRPVIRPVSAHVERVAPYADLAAVLGFGA